MYISGYIVTKVNDVITVVKDDNSNVPVNDITGLDAITMTVGEERTITASVLPSDATNKALTYSEYDTNVITISNGKIAAVASGTTSIKVTSVSDSSIYDSISVTVNSNIVALTGITLPSNSIELDVNETYALTPSFIPDNATNKSVTYSVSPSNTNIIEIVGGNVVGKTPGTATVIVTSNENSEITASLEVTVKVPVQSVNITESNLVLLFGEKRQFRATVTPNDATNSSVEWVSGNSNVITVGKTTGLVTAVGEGTTTLTVSSVMDNTKTDSITIRVTPSSTVCVLDSTNPNTGYTNTLIVNSVSYLTGDKYRCRPWTITPENQEEEYFNFYVLDANDSTDTISLLMDRNISGTSTMNWATATSYLETNNYSNQNQLNAIWNRVDSVTLPTAQQIANAGKITGWTQGGSWSYLGSSTTNTVNTNCANFAWLYDYTRYCKSCNFETTSGAYGYWTSTGYKTDLSPSSAWIVRGNELTGNVVSNAINNGVRPVIILSTSKLSQ